MALIHHYQHTIAISSCQCVRGFSQTNPVYCSFIRTEEDQSIHPIVKIGKSVYGCDVIGVSMGAMVAGESLGATLALSLWS